MKREQPWQLSVIDIPSPPGWPIIGNLLQIPRAQLSQHLLKTSRNYEGIFQMNFLGRRLPFVYSAELVAELCDQTRFRKVVAPPLSFLRNITGDGLFTVQSDNPQWEIAHRILMPAFNQSALENYFQQMKDVAQTLVNKWENKGPDTAINVVDDMLRFTLESITRCGFGYSFRSFESESLHPFLQALSRTLEFAMSRVRHLPYTRIFQRGRRQAERDVLTLINVVDEIIFERQHTPTDDKDLLNVMLNCSDPITGKKLDPTNIRHQVMTFLIAGHETTSGLLSFALDFLMRNSAVLAQAYAEVDLILPGDTPPSFEQIGQFKVLERVLKESLRLWPTAPAMVLAPFEDTVIGGKYPIAKDQWTSVILPALHRDPKVWSDPDSFDINRFLPENEVKLPPCAYLPFGSGRRACLGAQFALTESKLILAMILQRFELSDPYNYPFKIKECLSFKPENLYLKARKRQPHERLHQQPLSKKETIQPKPAPSQSNQTLTLLFGTSLGSTRNIAENIANQAKARGFSVQLGSIDDHLNDLPKQGVLIVITSTYYGKAPNTAQNLESLLNQQHSTFNLKGLKTAVLGIGNSQWPHYQAFSTRLTQWLSDAGAHPLVATGEIDNNTQIDSQVEAWLEQLWSQLNAHDLSKTSMREYNE